VPEEQRSLSAFEQHVLRRAEAAYTAGYGDVQPPLLPPDASAVDARVCASGHVTVAWWQETDRLYSDESDDSSDEEAEAMMDLFYWHDMYGDGDDSAAFSDDASSEAASDDNR
jgi:hypothetical protein